MLLDHYVVADGEAKSSTFTRWLGREEGVEHLLSYVGRDARAIVAYPNLHAVAEAFGCSGDGRQEPIAAFLPMALCRRIEAI